MKSMHVQFQGLFSDTNFDAADMMGFATEVFDNIVGKRKKILVEY